MKILVLGGGGYLGWPTCMAFAMRGDDVVCVESNLKPRIMRDLGLDTLNEFYSVRERIWTFNSRAERENLRPIRAEYISTCDYHHLSALIKEFQPDAIIHYAEQPSAPFSMMDQAGCLATQRNNIEGTLNLIWSVREFAPGAHIVKLGTMGEYGTPEIPIEEGWLEVRRGGRKARLPFPKLPGSFYHASKVADSVNLEFACRAWDLRVTDLNQGIVYGFIESAPIYYDHIFGTVLNRFIAQAVSGLPLTVYGTGGQKRAFLNIKDTLLCVALAVDHPAAPGEFRVMNQFTEIFSVSEIADKVIEAMHDYYNIRPTVLHFDNPRVELEDHLYEAKNTNLIDLGLKPIRLTEPILAEMIDFAHINKDRIDPKAVNPAVNWRK